MSLPALGWPTLAALGLAALAAVAACCWYLVRMHAASRLTVGLIVAGAGSAGAAAALVLHVRGGGPMQRWEATHWSAPSASGGWQAGLGRAVAAAADVHLLILAFIVLWSVFVVRRRLRESYLAAAAAALVAPLVVLRAFAHRLPPVGTAPFPLPNGAPDAVAALAVTLAAVAWWLGRRPGDTWRRDVRRAGVAAGLALVGASGPLLVGQAWPSDTLAGLAVGLAWSCAILLADHVASRVLTPRMAGVPEPVPLRVARRAWDATCAWADARLWGNTRVLWALVGLGVLLRLPGMWAWSIGPDAHRYAVMGWALGQHGEFLMPWGDVYYTTGMGEAYSHHFPPVYPAVLGLAYGAFGYSIAVTHVVAFVLGLLAIAVTWWCTRDLYGPVRGALAAAVVSLSPILVQTTNKAYAENLLLAFFVLAMWGILRSLERPWSIVWGALFAGLGYLTKSSMGYFFIVAGLGGLAWRLRWRGLKVLRDPAYLTGIAVFAACVVGWAWRNWLHFRSIDASVYITTAYANSVAHPGAWAALTVFSFLVIVGLGYLLFMAVAPWIPQLRRIPLTADEHDSGLWLAILLPIVLTVAIDASIWQYEVDFFLHNVRYVSFAIVPLVWLLGRHVRPSKATWAAIFASFAILLAGSLYYGLVPNQPLADRVSAEFGPLVHDGDSIAFVDWNDVYRFHFDVTHDATQTVNVTLLARSQLANATTTWIVLHGDPDDWNGQSTCMVRHGNSSTPCTVYTRVLDRATGRPDAGDRFTVWKRGTLPIAGP